MNTEEKVFIDLVPSHLRKKLKILLIKYADPNDSIREGLRKAIEGFHSESRGTVHQLHQKSQSELYQCEQEFLDIVVIQSKLLVDFSKCNSESCLNIYIEILDLCKSILNKVSFGLRPISEIERGKSLD